MLLIYKYFLTLKQIWINREREIILYLILNLL
jgi:hypothetical protein